MKLYQKFLYSILLSLIFAVYANYKFIEIENLKLKTVELNNYINALENGNKGLKAEITVLHKTISELSVQEERKTQEMIAKYITNHYRRTPVLVAKEISKNIVLASRIKKVAAPLLVGIIEIESGFNPYAVSKVNARGLMQVMPEWVGKLPTELKDQHDLHDIQTGIFAGADVFNIHVDEQKGSITKGLYYYVNKDKTYVTKVLSAVGKYLAYANQ
jgi:hypothetical protein